MLNKFRLIYSPGLAIVFYFASLLTSQTTLPHCYSYSFWFVLIGLLLEIHNFFIVSNHFFSIRKSFLFFLFRCEDPTNRQDYWLGIFATITGIVIMFDYGWFYSAIIGYYNVFYSTRIFLAMIIYLNPISKPKYRIIFQGKELT